MRCFVVLCLIAVAAAQYDYAPQAVSGGHDGGYSGGVSGGFPGGVSGGFPAGVSGGSVQSAPAPAPQQPTEEYNKEFYSFSAPNSEFQDAGGNDDAVSSLKKNLRVIFIKGPETNGIDKAAQQLAKFSNNDRTAIYVLTKQADPSELANKLSAIPQSNSQKPEVHFVKYRTPADAENAQRQIQSQYDSLPGSSTSTNGGQAPVLDFASKAPARNSAPSNQYVPPPAQPQASYLPPGKRF